MLVTTQEANRLIADVWFARADFARDHAPILEGIIRRHLRRHGAAQSKTRAKKVSELMAAGLQHPGLRRAVDAR